jgi:hypothetical protein
MMNRNIISNSVIILLVLVLSRRSHPGSIGA